MQRRRPKQQSRYLSSRPATKKAQTGPNACNARNKPASRARQKTKQQSYKVRQTILAPPPFHSAKRRAPARTPRRPSTRQRPLPTALQHATGQGDLAAAAGHASGAGPAIAGARGTAIEADGVALGGGGVLAQHEHGLAAVLVELLEEDEGLLVEAEAALLVAVHDVQRVLPPVGRDVVLLQRHRQHLVARVVDRHPERLEDLHLRVVLAAQAGRGGGGRDRRCCGLSAYERGCG